MKAPIFIFTLDSFRTRWCSMKEKLQVQERSDSRPYALVHCAFNLSISTSKALDGLSIATKASKQGFP